MDDLRRYLGQALLYALFFVPLVYITHLPKHTHLEQNMAACTRGPLPQTILDILDRGWEIIKPDCFRYFRP